MFFSGNLQEFEALVLLSKASRRLLASSLDGTEGEKTKRPSESWLPDDQTFLASSESHFLGRKSWFDGGAAATMPARLLGTWLASSFRLLIVGASPA